MDTHPWVPVFAQCQAMYMDVQIERFKGVWHFISRYIKMSKYTSRCLSQLLLPRLIISSTRILSAVGSSHPGLFHVCPRTCQSPLSTPYVHTWITIVHNSNGTLLSTIRLYASSSIYLTPSTNMNQTACLAQETCLLMCADVKINAQMLLYVAFSKPILKYLCILVSIYASKRFSTC